MTDYTKESIFLRAALTYARRSWYVFPLVPKSKKPLTENGVLDASTDETTIRKWWTAKPSANIGIATGKSGLAVIDVDNGGVFEHGEQTVVAHTPGGGRHVIYRYSGNVLSPGTDVLGKGVDLRVANSYIVAAPSIHPNGGVYKWDKDAHPARTELAELPAYLLDRLREAATPIRATQPSAEPIEMIGTGQDEYGARQAAVLARKGFAKQEAKAALEAMIETRFAGGWEGLDPRRPWKQSDVERWLKGAYAKFYDPDGGAPTDTEAIADLMGLERALAASATQLVPQSAVSRNKPRPPMAGITAAELQGREYAPTKWIITDVLPEGAAILGGKPKVGKSWLVLGLASAVASESEYAFGELTVSRGDVLYLALEDGEKRLKKRMKKILGAKPWPKRLTFFTEWPRVDQGGIDAIDKWIDDTPETQLIVIDTLKHIEPAEMTKANGGYRADYQSITPLQQLAQRRGVAILIVTHLRKLGSEDPIDMLQGTLGLSGGIDNFYVFTRPKNSLKGTLYYRGRDVEEGELALVWREGDSMLWRIDDAAEAPKAGDAVLEAIKPGEALSPQELADRIGLPADTVRQRLKRLADTGQIVRLERGSYCLPATPIDAF